MQFFFCLKAHIERYRVVIGFKTSVVNHVIQEVVITREIKEENGLVPKKIGCYAQEVVITRVVI